NIVMRNVVACHLGSLALAGMLAGFAIGWSWAAGAEDDSSSAPAAASTTADYVGPTTANSYTPLPDMDAEGTAFAKPPIHVESISDELRRGYRLNPFYKKTLTINGIPIVASEKVSDYALLECAYTLDHMLADSPKKVKDALVRNKVRMGIISVVEY